MNKPHKIPAYTKETAPHAIPLMKILSSFDHSDTRYYHDQSCMVTELSGVCTCGLLDILHNLNIQERVYIPERIKHELNCQRPGMHVSGPAELKMPICKVKI